MKAITVDQPHASHVVRGTTDMLVRTHPAPPNLWGERIGLHASKTPICPEELSPGLQQQIGGSLRLSLWIRTYPLGMVVGTAVVRFSCEIVPTPPDKIGLTCAEGEDEAVKIRVEFPVTDEHDFQVGAHVWFFQDAELLIQPVPERGRLGLWTWDQPADTLRENPRARRVRRFERRA